MFHQLIQHKRDEWFASPDCTVGDVIAYIVRRGMMRDAQIEAIKTYLYLKIACGNKPLWQLYCEGTFNTLDPDRMPLTGMARDVVKSNPAAAALLEYALLKDRKDITDGSSASKFVRINVSDEGLETIEWLSLDCHNAGKSTPWHSDVEVKIDKAGYAIRDGKPTGRLWDGTISTDDTTLKPLRLKVRNICGDETVVMLDGSL